MKRKGTINFQVYKKMEVDLLMGGSLCLESLQQCVNAILCDLCDEKEME